MFFGLGHFIYLPLMTTIRLLKTAFTTGDYYRAMNNALKTLDGSYQMLHYPYYNEDTTTFDEAQENLINYCTSHLPPMQNKEVLDIGCGNGTVAMYLADNYNLERILGVDLNHNNVRIANEEKAKRKDRTVHFIREDAQNLKQIASNSFDVVINIESAFHYPDKGSFLDEVHRVLKPGGEFIIADIVTNGKSSLFLKAWKQNMNFNHWTLNDYLKTFKKNSLELLSHKDISPEVIKGFQAYPSFLSDFEGSWLMKLFFIINVKLNIFLLSRKRRYYVFHGRKAR